MWVIYALLSAFFAASTDPIAKRALKVSDEYLIGWGMLLFSLPFLAIPFFTHEIAPFNIELAKTLVLVVSFEIVAIILYYKALRLTDISLSVPFLALTPIFAIFTAFLILGEGISPYGAIGIGLITAGAYSLNWSEARFGFAHPIKALLANKGSLYMVMVAVLFSVTSTISKKALLLSTAYSIPFIYNLFIVAIMCPVVLYRVKTGRSRITLDKNTIFIYMALGLFSAISSIFYFKAIGLANVAYVISIKRLSLLMSVGYGWLLFKERDIRIRFLSTFCMFLGVLLIILTR